MALLGNNILGNTTGQYIPGLIATADRILNPIDINDPDFEARYSGQSYLAHPIKRMEFVYKTKTFKFKLNPEEYTQSEPNRVTLTQTKGGAWLDAWGGGIIEITIKGTTGVYGHNTLADLGAKLLVGETLKDVDRGYRKFKELRKLFRDIYADAIDGKEITELLKFYNYTDNEYYYCYPKPEGITLYRSKSKPHIYQYSIGLYALRRIGEPEKATITLGNPVKPKPPTPAPPEKTPEKTSGNPQKTSSSQTTDYKGGVTSSKGSRLTSLPGVDKDVYTSTKTKPNSYIINDARIYAEKLASIVGGRNGKLSPTTAYQSCSGISMQAIGTVSNVRGFKCADINPDVGILHKTLQFIPKCSSETYVMYNGIKQYSPDYLSTEYLTIPSPNAKQKIMQSITLGTQLDSTLYESALNCKLKAQITRTEMNQIKLILLESMYVYLEIYKLGLIEDVYAGVTSNLSVSQVIRLINNIDSMNYYMKETFTTENMMDRLDICNSLRELSKVLTQINMDILSYM